MTPEIESQLLATFRKGWYRMRARLAWVSLPSQDWEDLKSEALRRVFVGFDTYDHRKGTLDGWGFTVVKHSIQNGLRRLLPNPRVKAHKWRTLFQRPTRLYTRIVEVNPYGDEEVVVEPDLVDPATEPEPGYSAVDQREQFCAGLNKRDQRLIDLAGKGLSPRQIVAQIGRPVGVVYNHLFGLKRLYLAYTVGLAIGSNRSRSDQNRPVRSVKRRNAAKSRQISTL